MSENKREITLKNTSFYLRSDEDGSFFATVAYALIDGNVFGAYYGYAGGGVYDGGFFKLDLDSFEYKILDFSEAEESDDADIFNGLMQLCGETRDDDDQSQLSADGSALLESGEETEDGGKVCMVNGFDGDMLSEISENWNIFLRFES